MIWRVVSGCVLLGSIFLFPWVVTLALFVLFAFVFKEPYEIIVVGVLDDILYGLPHASFLGNRFSATIETLLIFATVLILKTWLRFDYEDLFFQKKR